MWPVLRGRLYISKCQRVLGKPNALCGHASCGRSHKPCLRCGTIVPARDKNQEHNWKKEGRYESVALVRTQCEKAGYSMGDLTTQTFRFCNFSGPAKKFDANSVHNAKKKGGRMPPICLKVQCKQTAKKKVTVDKHMNTHTHTM